MNIPQPFILCPIATTLLMTAVPLAAAIADYQLPVAALPEVEYPTVQIVTFYPGANPDVMASSVTAPPGAPVRSGFRLEADDVPRAPLGARSSRFGSRSTEYRYRRTGSAGSINAASSYLPRDLPNPPIYNSVSTPVDAPVLTLTLTSKTLPLSKVEDLADTVLVEQMSQLPGVGLVSISGGQKPGVRIRVNPPELAAYGLGLEDVQTARGSERRSGEGQF